MNIRLSGNIHIKVLIAFTLICLTLFLSSCGISDWSYDLPNGYEIVRVNSYSVVFGKNGRRFNTTIDRYVIAFCHNDSYIGLKRVPLDNVPFDEKIDIDSYDDSNIEY